MVERRDQFRRVPSASPVHAPRFRWNRRAGTSKNEVSSIHLSRFARWVHEGGGVTANGVVRQFGHLEYLARDDAFVLFGLYRLHVQRAVWVAEQRPNDRVGPTWAGAAFALRGDDLMGFGHVASFTAVRIRWIIGVASRSWHRSTASRGRPCCCRGPCSVVHRRRVCRDRELACNRQGIPAIFPLRGA